MEQRLRKKRRERLSNFFKTGETRLDSPTFIPARFLNGEKRSMNTIPMLKICTPPPDMYNMKNCIGSCFAGEIERSQARFSFNEACEAAAAAAERAGVRDDCE